MASTQMECEVEKLADDIAEVGVEDRIVSDTDSEDELKKNCMKEISG